MVIVVQNSVAYNRILAIYSGIDGIACTGRKLSCEENRIGVISRAGCRAPLRCNGSRTTTQQSTNDTRGQEPGRATLDLKRTTGWTIVDVNIFVDRVSTSRQFDCDGSLVDGLIRSASNEGRGLFPHGGEAAAHRNPPRAAPLDEMFHGFFGVLVEYGEGPGGRFEWPAGLGSGLQKSPLRLRGYTRNHAWSQTGLIRTFVSTVQTFQKEAFRTARSFLGRPL